MWQPNDLLPDSSGSDEQFYDEVRDLRARCADLPDALLVVLIGDMITEEALPTYMAMLNTLDGVRDETGASPSPWGQWTRQWVAEENRHGDLMNKFCWLTGRVNMRSVEVTIQNLIGSGMNPKTENNPYLGFVYTSFQERATKVSHGNTARLALEYGDETLSKICGAIAADESRHEIAYTRIIDELFRQDPNGAMLAFADMMRKQIVMPAHLMDDMEHGAKNGGRNLFEDFSIVAEDLGVYNAVGIDDELESGMGSRSPHLEHLVPVERRERVERLARLVHDVRHRRGGRFVAHQEPWRGGWRGGTTTVGTTRCCRPRDGSWRAPTLFFLTLALPLALVRQEDYCDIMEHLIERWEVNNRVVTGDAAEAQEYLMKLPARIRKLSERANARKAKAPKKEVSFSWIFDHKLSI